MEELARQRAAFEEGHMSKKAPKSKKIEVRDIGPVRIFQGELHVGMNILSGENGAGKSAVCAALARAAGVPIDVEPNDFAAKGLLSIDGTVLLAVTRGKAKGKSGDAEISLASVSPLATVIDPDIKDRKAAEAARIRALVSICALKTDEELIAELL